MNLKTDLEDKTGVKNYAKKAYTEDEKLEMEKPTWKVGSQKYRFVMSHSEYKPTTLFKWINKYSK